MTTKKEMEKKEIIVEKEVIYGYCSN